MKARIKVAFGILFLFSSFFQIDSQEKKTIVVIRLVRGYSKLPVSDATIVVKKAQVSGVTDKEGTLKLSFSNPDFYEFRVVLPDKVQTFTREVRFSGQEITLALPEPNASGLVVQGERDKAPLSRYGLNQEEIKRLPGVSGDSLKALQTIPGIAIGVPVGLVPTVFSGVAGAVEGVPYTNSTRGDLSLRGGGTRQNLFLFDGFLLPYAFHLGNQSSVLNNNIIKSFDVYTGAFPARYGFATGGVIAIDGVDRVDENKTVLNINLFLTDAYNQTKILPGLSMVTAGRKNYPNFVLLRTYPEGIPQDAKFAEYHDFQWKLFWDLNSDHKLIFQTFGSRDRQAYTRQLASVERDGADPRPPVGLDRQFRTDGIRYIWKGKNFRNTLSYSRTEFREFFELRFSNPATGENIFGLQNRTADTFHFAEQRLEFEILEDMLKWEVGAQSRVRETTLKGENISSRNRLFNDIFDNLLNNSASFRSVIDGDRIRLREGALYTELQSKWKGFRFTPGARVDYYDGSGETNLSPRVSGGYVIDSTKTSFLGGHGIHYNSPVSVEQLSAKSGNPNLFMERSEHNAIGVAQEFPNGWNLKLEAFRNLFQNIVVPDNFAVDPYSKNIDPRIAVRDLTRGSYDPLISRSLAYSNSGYGSSEGWELFLKKTKDPREVSGLFGWISYTNSITKRINNQPRTLSEDVTRRNLENQNRRLLSQTLLGTNYLNYYDDNSIEVVFNNDRKELYDLDRTHILNVVFGYKFNEAWQLGGRFRYFSGAPYTPIVNASRVNQLASTGFNLFLPEYSGNFNSDRFIPYHQIDIRLDKFITYDWGYFNWYIELVNLYGRRNVSGQDFDNFRAYQRGSNPAPIFDTVNSPYVQVVRPGGNLVFIPILNIGMEVRF